MQPGAGGALHQLSLEQLGPRTSVWPGQVAGLQLTAALGGGCAQPARAEKLGTCAARVLVIARRHLVVTAVLPTVVAFLCHAVSLSSTIVSYSLDKVVLVWSHLGAA